MTPREQLQQRWDDAIACLAIELEWLAEELAQDQAKWDAWLAKQDR